MAKFHPSKTLPNRPDTALEPPQTTTQKTRHHTRGAGGGWSGGAFAHPMAAVEVCVVAWLAWGVVAGLLVVVWGGSGAVSG